jgi:DNA gyrase subunit A
VLPLTGEFRSFPSDHYVFMATALGTVKKTPLDEFSNPRKAGIIAVDLDEGDHLIGAALTDGKHDVMLFSDGGKAVRFDEDDVRPWAARRAACAAWRWSPGQKVIAMLVAEDETQSVLTATENGYGKRTHRRVHPPRPRHQGHDRHPAERAQRPRRGRHAGAPADEIMLITDRGVLVRTRANSAGRHEIRELRPRHVRA